MVYFGIDATAPRRIRIELFRYLMTRRDALIVSTALALKPARAAAAPAGRLKQSVARWCYARIPLDDLCRQAAEMGLAGVDLVDPPD